MMLYEDKYRMEESHEKHIYRYIMTVLIKRVRKGRENVLANRNVSYKEVLIRYWFASRCPDSSNAFLL